MKMEPNERYQATEVPKEGDVIFAPLEHIRNIENVLDKLEKTRYELKRVAEEMKLVES